MVITENDYSQKIHQVAANEMENKYKCWELEGLQEGNKIKQVNNGKK